VIGALSQYLFAPEDPQAVIDALSAPQTRIISMTITEELFFLIPATRRPSLLTAAHRLIPDFCLASLCGMPGPST